MMTKDVEALPQIYQHWHCLLSMPLYIVVSIVLLYKEIGMASLLDALILVLMYPLQTFVISRMKKPSKEALQCTNKRIDGMNEIVVAMDTVAMHGKVVFDLNKRGDLVLILDNLYPRA